MQDTNATSLHIFIRFGVQYRKARYLISIYSGLVAAGVPWDAVKSIGWSKLKELIPILTQENVKEWVERAEKLNLVSLHEAVKQALADGATKVTAPTSSAEFKTKSFKLAPDQVEIVEDALKDAMTKGSTDHAGTGLEYICTEYLNSAQPGQKLAGADAAKLKARIAELEEQLAGVPEGAKELTAKLEETQAELEVARTSRGFFSYCLKQAGGDTQEALKLALKAWDELFPEITISLTKTNAA